MKIRDRSRGFSLVEVLVAFAIAALALAAILQALAKGARSAAVSAQYERALVIAESHMELLHAAATDRPEHTAGREAGYEWMRMVDTFESGGPPGAERRVRLMRLRVEVRWPPRAVALESLALVPEVR